MPSIKLRFPSNRTLGTICAYGAVLSISAVMYMRWQLEDRVRSTEYYKSAMQALRKHRGAISLLGEPIKEMGFDLSNPNNTCNANHAQIEVNVKGPKDKGTVYFWASHHLEKGWLIDRLELEAKKHPNKRFLLRQGTNGKKPSSDDPIKDIDHGPTNENNATDSFPAASTAQPLHQKDSESEPYVQSADGGKMV